MGLGFYESWGYTPSDHLIECSADGQRVSFGMPLPAKGKGWFVDARADGPAAATGSTLALKNNPCTTIANNISDITKFGPHTTASEYRDMHGQLDYPMILLIKGKRNALCSHKFGLVYDALNPWNSAQHRSFSFGVAKGEEPYQSYVVQQNFGALPINKSFMYAEDCWTTNWVKSTTYAATNGTVLTPFTAIQFGNTWLMTFRVASGGTININTLPKPSYLMRLAENSDDYAGHYGKQKQPDTWFYAQFFSTHASGPNLTSIIPKNPLMSAQFDGHTTSTTVSVNTGDQVLTTTDVPLITGTWYTIAATFDPILWYGITEGGAQPIPSIKTSSPSVNRSTISGAKTMKKTASADSVLTFGDTGTINKGMIATTSGSGANQLPYADDTAGKLNIKLATGCSADAKTGVFNATECEIDVSQELRYNHIRLSDTLCNFMSWELGAYHIGATCTWRGGAYKASPSGQDASLKFMHSAQDRYTNAVGLNSAPYKYNYSGRILNLHERQYYGYREDIL